LTALSGNPLVSVILPVFNGAEFVGCALESVILQTYRNLEIVVVNDGSTDQSEAVLQTWAARDARVRVITQSNAGVARARNRAIAESTGEFIAPIDADDLWSPDKIARQLKCMLSAGDETGLVYSWWVWIDEQGKVLDRSPRWMIQGNALEKLIFINFTGSASVPLYRRHCLEEIGGYNETLAAAHAGGCEDWEVALRVAAKYRVAVVPEILLGYRRRPGSMSSACDTMWRSEQLVMEGLRKLRPDLKPALFRASENQFSMYLAGLSYWSGNARAAWQWALRAGVRLPVLVSPYVAKMLLWPRRGTRTQQTMRPGAKLVTARIPEPLLPFDRVGDVRGALVRTVFAALRLVAGSFIPSVQHLIHWIFLMRLTIECKWNAGSAAKKKKRVWATACWHFPIYSQTFVYRELGALMNAGFEVCFAYSGLAPRSELPDDSASLWQIRRRVPIFDATASSDLSHYRRLMPQRIQELVVKIADASGLSAEEVYAHRHFRNAFTFTRMAQAWGADYIHTYFFYEQALYGLVAATLLDLPRGVSCYADHMLPDYELKMIGLHMRTCDIVVATSARIKNELEDLAGDRVSAAIMKPNGIDVSRYATRVPKPSGPVRIFKMVAVNRIHPKKGLEFLIEAATLLRHARLEFVVEILGEPDHHPPTYDYFEELKQLVAANGLKDRVLFRGRQTAAEVRAHLADADIFVAPFIELENGDKDGIPTALLEGMAAGCAAIVTDAGSILEVVTDGVDGVVVSQRNPRMLAEAIERLAGDDRLRDRLSRAGRERVRQQFDVNRCEGAFHSRIREAIERRNPFRSKEAAHCGPGALRIALLSFEYPPETGFGGIGTYTWYQARAFVRMGHQVHVLAGARECLPLRMSEHDGVFVHRYRSDGLWAPIAGLLTAGKCYWTKQRLENAWNMYRAFRQLMTRYDYDIIEMPECGAEGALINWLIRLPAIIRFHSPARLIMDLYDVPQVDRVMCPWIERIGIRGATGLSSCSHFLAREVSARLGVNQEVEVIYNGIDLPLFDAEPVADLASLYGCPKDQITILFAGRIERRKGIHLCGAIAEIVLSRSDVTFLFAGEDLFGYMRQTLLPSLAKKKLAGSIRYLGKLNFQELRACARAVDIYLLPSLWENCPYSCLEAMAAGRAIVCSDQGGLPELIEHGSNGLLATSGSPESFAAQLQILIEDRELRQALGAAARQSIELRFTDDSIAAQTEKQYRKLLARQPGGTQVSRRTSSISIEKYAEGEAR
jgi:glycosyltransferase involved in cell wall biosynthesis